MQKQKSTNLHDFQHQLFLGFITQQPLPKTQYEISYLGGQALWLYEPNEKLLICEQCSNQSLTFLGQVFCPLNANHCYNRIMYMFFCDRCKRFFRCIKQQTDENWQPKKIQSGKYKKLCQQSYEIQSDSIQRKQLLKIINRAKIQVQEQIIMQQEDDDEEKGQEIITVQKMTGQQMFNKLGELQKAKKNKQYTEKEIQQINKKFQSLKLQEKQTKQKEGFKQIQGNKKDYLFQQYIKVIKQINNPVMIYSNIPIPYNKTPLNPKHTCKFCGSKLQLQIQFTQKLLLLHKSLAIMDWGSIFIYACTGSCKQSQNECVVLQYEFDAISQELINKLKKTKKTRKRNKNKSLSKQKKRQQSINSKIEPQLIKNKNQLQEDESQEQQNENNMKQKNKQQKQTKKEEEGDWD